jgi:hypothetical protein
MRVIAIDWSGMRTGAERNIWLAEVRDGQLNRLENGRTREQVADHLISEAARDPQTVIGFDFAFSLPAWFLEARCISCAPELWSIALHEAEDWLSPLQPPFWGRPGTRRPDLPQHFRHTDLEVPAVGGIRPKSPFQIGGAGAVGTGSVRGWHVLHRLRSSGFSIWPFDEPGWPRVVEIYPRLLTGPVSKKRRECRAAYLAEQQFYLQPAMRESAERSDDAFDAAVSALRMWVERDDLATLPAVTDPIRRLEGQIWHPK